MIATDAYSRKITRRREGTERRGTRLRNQAKIVAGDLGFDQEVDPGYFRCSHVESNEHEDAEKILSAHFAY